MTVNGCIHCSGADPYAQPTATDPHAQPMGTDPRALLTGTDPRALPTGTDPHAQPTRADPHAQPTRTDPHAQPTRTDPRAQPTHTDPHAQPMGTDPRAQPTRTDPHAQPTHTDPHAQPTRTDPHAQPTRTDPHAQPTRTGPRAQPTHTDPHAQPMGTDPRAQPTRTDPHAQPTHTDPHAQPTRTDPHAQPTRTDPHAQPTHTDPHAQPTNAIDLYAKYLRGKYKIGFPKFLSLQWPPPPTRKIFNLAMSSGQKSVVRLQEIFQIDTAERKVILIEGPPGSGKSTLAWHICKQWQSGDLFQEFHTVVFVQLQDSAIHSATSVEHILPATKRIQTAAVVAELQAYRGRGMLWVLDGWDELPQHLRTDSIFHKLITVPAELDLDSSTILITSRLVASGELYHSITSRIEILGFTPAEVKEYFTEALEGDIESVEKLQNYLKEKPLLEEACHIPSNAAIITHLFVIQNLSLPTTLHEVFTMLVIACLIRQMQKQGEECRISSLDSLPSRLKEPLRNICSLAFHGVMKNQTTFSEVDFKQLGLPLQLDTLGLIQGDETFTSLHRSISYKFLSSSVQQLLASFYISKLPGSEEIEVFKVLFGQPRYATVFQFYAGFTKLKTQGIREIVANIVKKRDKPETVYLLQGLYEARDVSLCQFVISQLSGELDLSQTSLSPVDCLSIGYFVCCVCLTTEGKFAVNLCLCSLDVKRVSFLVKEFSKFISASKTTKTELHLK